MYISIYTYIHTYTHISSLQVIAQLQQRQGEAAHALLDLTNVNLTRQLTPAEHTQREQLSHALDRYQAELATKLGEVQVLLRTPTPAAGGLRPASTQPSSSSSAGLATTRLQGSGTVASELLLICSTSYQRY